jgi:hypothetical protein
MVDVTRERAKWEKPDHGVGLEYGSVGFSVRVRKLIAAGERVTFDVTGGALHLLRPYVARGDMSALMGATVVPELGDLVVAVVLAQSHSFGVSISVSEEAAHVELGPRVS